MLHRFIWRIYSWCCPHEDGEVVWSWRPTLAPSFADYREVTVPKELGSPGRARYKP
jgi:hypothetical protein